MPDPAEVNAMFARIAARYDLANRVLSAGVDRRWRRRLVEAVAQAGPGSVLDLATGSGDVAFALRRALPPAAAIVGADFCVPMLERARGRQAAKTDGGPTVEFVEADALALPFADARFDAATIAFGLRNLADRGRGLAEMRRVLRSGGRLFVLEFSRPRGALRPLYALYLRGILPRLAGWLTGEPQAYRYLADSIDGFPDQAAVSAEILAAGFSAVAATALSGGIVALHEAVN